MTWDELYATCREAVIIDGEGATVDLDAADPFIAVLLRAHHAGEEGGSTVRAHLTAQRIEPVRA